MRLRFGPFVLALLLLGGCGSDTERRTTPVPGPRGTWALDVEALKASFSRMIDGQVAAMVASGEVAPDGASAMRADMLSQMGTLLQAKEAVFTFDEDGSFSGSGSDGSMEGRWTVEGSRIAMTIEKENDRLVPRPDVWRGTWSADAVVLRPEPDKDYEMTLRPMKEER